MTKQQLIQDYVDCGHWIPLVPIIGSKTVRSIYMPVSLPKELENIPDVDIVRLQTSMEKFLDGSHITVGFEPTDNCDLKRLRTDPEEEIWTFRSLKPEPSIRIFGTFIDVDVFLAIHVHLRSDLDGLEEELFLKAIREARFKRSAEFNKLGAIKYQTGGKINDYISSNALPAI